MVREIEWDEVREWFDPAENGSAPDIVVGDTTPDDWQTLLTLIRVEGWRAEYDRGDVRMEVPASAVELFAPDPVGWVRSLWVWPRPDLEVIFRVWSPDVMVGDVSLHQLQGQERLDDFCGILRRLGQRLGKRVEVHAEGDHDSYPPMLAYEIAQDRVVFLAGPWS